MPLLVFSTPGRNPAFDSDDLQEAEDETLEANILERLTRLEDGLKRLSEALAASAGHVGQLEHNLTVTHAGIQMLTSLLEQRGIVSRSEMMADWERTADHEFQTRELARRFGRRTDRVFSQAHHDGSATAEFRRRLRALEESLLGVDLAVAVEQMRDLGDLVPNNDELWSLLGETAFEIGDLETAAEAFERALELRGPHAEALIYLGTIRSDLGQWNRAEEALLAARELDPTAFLPNFTLGALAGMKGEPDQAVRHLERAIEADPLPQAFYLLGTNSLDLGRTGRAVKALVRAVELAPEFEDALYQLGVAYLRRGWNRKSLETFRRVLHLDPRRLRYQETVRLFGTGTAPDLPEPAGRRAAQAEQALLSGRQDYAFELFSQAIAIAPSHPQLRATAALLAAAMGRHRAAVRHAHALLHLDDPESPFLAAGVAALLSSLRLAGHPSIARRFALHFDGFRENPPIRGIAAFEFALVSLDLGTDLQEARDMALEALEIMPRELLHFPLAALGALAIEGERFREAVRYLEQAAENTHAPDVMRLLGIARLGAGDAEGAQRALEAAPDPAVSNLHTDLIGRLQRLSGLPAELEGRTGTD